jgi:hypothetical protein
LDHVIIGEGSFVSLAEKLGLGNEKSGLGNDRSGLGKGRRGKGG